MSAALSYSIAALLPEGDLAAKEAALLAVARACPGVVFHDRVGERAVRVGEALETIDKPPPHAGQTITRDAREKFGLFEDHGDILLPGWDPSEHAFEIEIAGEQRVLGALSQVAAEIDDILEEDELDEDEIAFLRLVREALATAEEEQLPVVAHW